jgi:hypothetical protein
MRRCCGTQNDSPAVISGITRLIEEISGCDRDIYGMRDRATIVDGGQQIVIPIHFHICYANPNVVQVQGDVAWTIEMLNRDFNGNATNKNSNDNSTLVIHNSGGNQAIYTEYKSRMGNMNVQFTLASIVYVARPVQTTSSLSVLDANIKSFSPSIAPESCLNVWVADVTSGLLGYAQFPWEFNNATKRNDGVLIVKGAFGQNAAYPNFNMSKTMTHEVGHWFGLYHTFQNTFSYQGGNIDYLPGNNAAGELKGDCVVDTPPQAVPTYGNPFLTTSWPSSKSTDEVGLAPTMMMNFMDYVDDAAMFMFTTQQVAKMRQMVYLYRQGIVATTIVTPTDTPVVDPPVVVVDPPPTPPVVPPVVPTVYFSCNFENPSDVAKWVLSPKANAKIELVAAGNVGSSGNRTLNLKNVASAECKIDLSAAQVQKLPYVTLQFKYMSTSSTATFSIKGPNDKNWKRTRLVTSNSVMSTMRTQTVRIPTPFKKGLLGYSIRFDIAQSGKVLSVDDLIVKG